MRSFTINPAALRDLLPQAGCVGVRCTYCMARPGTPCETTSGAPAPGPHRPRVREAAAVRRWLLQQGIDCGEYADA